MTAQTSHRHGQNGQRPVTLALLVTIVLLGMGLMPVSTEADMAQAAANAERPIN
ncbi:MAG: hypothetical protein AAFY65_08125 [Pseudomonadota bacterium]